MDHHAIYSDINSSYNSNGLSTNVKYHIPPQPPPTHPNSIYHLPGHLDPIHQPVQQPPQQQTPLQQNQGHGNLNVFQDDLFDSNGVLCSNNISSYSNINQNQNQNSNKIIEYSRKFETNTGDSITYNINNINTNIVNNISSNSSSNSSHSHSANALTNGPNDFLSGIVLGKEETIQQQPTVINISNNNNNMMGSPYHGPYYPPPPTKMPSSITPLNELNNKFGANPCYPGNPMSDYSAAQPNHYDANTGLYHHEAKSSTSKYQSSRVSHHHQTYRYPPEYPHTTPNMHHTKTYPNYGPYHPDNVQVTSTPNQPMMNHYGTYPSGAKYQQPPTLIEDTNRYIRPQNKYPPPQPHVSTSNRYYPNGYVQHPMPTQHSYYPSSPNSVKNILSPNFEYFTSNANANSFIKHPSNGNHHYINNRHGYQFTPYYHHQVAPNYDEGQFYQAHHHHNLAMKNYGPQFQPNEPKIPSPTTKNVNNFNYQQYYNNTHYGGNVPQMAQNQSTMQKSQMRNCFLDVPSPIVDIHHPLEDLEEQINCSKILKAQNPMSYDCQQKYLMNRYINGTDYGQCEDRDYELVENSKGTNLRDFLLNWNDFEEEEEPKDLESIRLIPPIENQQHSGVIVANINSSQANSNLPDILADIDKQKSGNETTVEPAVSPDSEKLYILEKIEVPPSELNKYKHLSVISQLPDHIVPITDKEINVEGVENSLKFLEEIEANEKYYKNDLELEVDYDSKDKEDKEREAQNRKKAAEADNTIPTKNSVIFKVPEAIPKYRKRNKSNNVNVIVTKKRKTSDDCDHYDNLVQNERKFKTLKTLCVDHFNSKIFRKYTKDLIKLEKEKKVTNFIKDMKNKFILEKSQKEKFSTCTKSIGVLKKHDFIKHETKCDVEISNDLVDEVFSTSTKNEKFNACQNTVEDLTDIEENITNFSEEDQEIVENLSTKNENSSKENFSCKNDENDDISKEIDSHINENFSAVNIIDSTDDQVLDHTKRNFSTENENIIDLSEEEQKIEEKENIIDLSEEEQKVVENVQEIDSTKNGKDILEKNQIYSENTNIENKEKESVTKMFEDDQKLIENHQENVCPKNEEKHFLEIDQKVSNENFSSENENFIDISDMDQKLEGNVCIKNSEEKITDFLEDDKKGLEYFSTKNEENAIHFLAENSEVLQNTEENEENIILDDDEKIEKISSTKNDENVSNISDKGENIKDRTVEKLTKIEENIRDFLEESQEIVENLSTKNISEENFTSENDTDVSKGIVEQEFEIEVDEDLKNNRSCTKNTVNEDVIDEIQETLFSLPEIVEELQSSDIEEKREIVEDSLSTKNTKNKIEDIVEMYDDITDVSEESKENQEIKEENISTCTKSTGDENSLLESSQDNSSTCNKVTENLDSVSESSEEVQNNSFENIEEASETTISTSTNNSLDLIEKKEVVMDSETSDLEPQKDFSTCTKFQIKSLSEICQESLPKIVYNVTSFKEICFNKLLSLDLLPQPLSLVQTCESFICTNKHLFIIEEITNEVPKLQDLCKNLLSETNIFIDEVCFEENENDVFIVEEDSGRIEDLLSDFDGQNSDEDVIFLDDANNLDENFNQTKVCNLNESEDVIERELERMHFEESPQLVEIEAFDIDYIQCEEIVPVNDHIYQKEKLLEHLRTKYLNRVKCSLVEYRKTVFKYTIYQRFMHLKNHGIIKRSRIFCKNRTYMTYFQKKLTKKMFLVEETSNNVKKLDIFEMNVEENAEKITEIIDDNDDESSKLSSSSSNSCTSSNSSATSEESSTESSQNKSLATTFQESLKEETTNSSVSTNNSSFSSISSSIITDNINNDKKPLEKPSRKHQNVTTNTNNHINKKRKPNFDECLLSIDKYYQRNSTSSPSAVKKHNHPNVIINVRNETPPRKLIIPSYKIFDQSSIKSITTNSLNADSTVNKKRKIRIINQKVPFVRLERQAFIEKLAKNYKQGQNSTN